jgi:hypothetical protein
MTKEDRKYWFGGRRWTGYGAIAVLVLIAFLVAAAFNTSRKQNQAATPAETPSVATASPTVPPKTSNGPADDQPLTKAPSGVSWQLIDRVALPFSTAAGPTKTTRDVASGFSQTATGALIASMQTFARTGWVNPAAQEAEFRQMATGDGKAAILAQLPAPQLTVRPQFEGFRYIAYSPNRAVVNIAARVTDAAAGQTSLVGLEMSMAWKNGDWRISFAAGPEADSPTLQNLSGYVPFAGA